ncbi:uncharacterized protein [Rutidosis leptorrhynchoides]|uniref:uncharacterized protein n=1 Tax=Rutidosis leptorrhynchoides TaxID=125765 RepID=UPI003A99CA8D
MPVFEGEDAYGWIYRVERYFEVQGIPPQEQLRAAAICMEGEALSWYRWRENRTLFYSWDGFKRRLLIRFNQSQGGNLYEQFLAIKQEGIVREYVALFEKLACQLVGVPDLVMEATFIKGLKPDLRAAVRIMKPENLAHAIELAISIEDNQLYEGVTRARSGTYRTNSDSPGYNRNSGLVSTRSSAATTRVPVPTPTVKGGTLNRAGQYKRLTEAELSEKCSKGLCFKCDEKYAPGHRCPSKSLQVLLVREDDDDNDEILEDSEHAHLDSVEVCINSVIGFTPPHTMKLRGSIGGLEVIVLIDCGASHNFISTEVVQRLGLIVYGNKSVGMMMGNGKFDKSQGVCRGVVLSLPELQVFEDFFPMELGSTDVILGMKWLQTLGEMTVNWKTLTIEFSSGDKRVIIRGDSGLRRSFVSLKSMCKALQAENGGFLIELRSLEMGSDEPNSLVPHVLEKFKDVFSSLQGLPPHRDHEHTIILKDGTEPISVRPY